MKTLTADKVLKKTFQHLKVMLDENQEHRSRDKKRQNITNRHICPKYQTEKQEFVVDQENNDNH
jgi:hypothetical protein